MAALTYLKCGLPQSNVRFQKYAGLLVNNVAVPLSVRRRLASGLAEDEPIAIEGIRNVWCCFATVGKKSALTEYHLD